MPAKLVYTVHIKKLLPPKPGKPQGHKWKNVGAVVQFENGGLGGNIEFLPIEGWDGRFLLFPPDKGTPGAGEVPAIPEEDVTLPPY